MNVEEVLSVMDELLDKSWSLPLSGGRCVVDAEKVRDLIDDIRINLPGEIKRAKDIVADRGEILAGAAKEADGIVRRAEEKAKAMIAQEEVTKQAQARANEIMSYTQLQSREMREAAQKFSDDILKASEEALAKSYKLTEETLTKSISELRSARQTLRGSGKKR